MGHNSYKYKYKFIPSTCRTPACSVNIASAGRPTPACSITIASAGRPPTKLARLHCKYGRTTAFSIKHRKCRPTTHQTCSMALQINHAYEKRLPDFNLILSNYVI